MQKVPVWNQIAEKYKDRPVKFLAINSGTSKAAVEGYRRRTGLTYPILADDKRATEKAYGIEISLRDIIRWRVIDAAGNIVGSSPSDGVIQRALRGASFTVLDKREWSAAFRPIAEDIEWGRIGKAIPQLAKLKRLRSRLKGEQAEDYDTLLRLIRENAAQRIARAREEEAAGRKFAAYRIYLKVAEECLPLDERPSFGAKKKTAGEGPSATPGADAKKEARRLSRDKDVKKEITAMTYYARAMDMVGSRSRTRQAQGRTLLRQIRAKYPDTEAGRLAAQQDG